jgi:DNA-binding beta-propeller fold protein YncE
MVPSQMIYFSLLLYVSIILPSSKAFTLRKSTHQALSLLHQSTPYADIATIQDNREIILKGKHKWLGGAVDSYGCIWGIPSNAPDVICLAPSSDSGEYQVHKIPLSPEISKGKFKWLRGIICDGYLYGIPAWSNAGILRVDIDSYWKRRQIPRSDDIVQILTLPEYYNFLNIATKTVDQNIDGEYPTRWLWHGAALNKEKNAIYAIPSNAHHVLKLDLSTFETKLLPIPVTKTPLTQTNKWYGGILGDDNAIYGVPYAAAGVLRIDTKNDSVQLIGEESFDVAQYNWHGGIKSPKNGKIYCFPAHNSHVLSIDTNSDRAGTESSLDLLSIHRASYDKDTVTKYKWLGGALGADGNIYGMPSDATSILRIDTETNSVTTFGRISGEKNKYQGGTLSSKNGFVYAIPSNSEHILCINTNPGQGLVELDSEVQSCEIGNIPKRKDKFQGGFEGADGSIYCIPENFDRILKISPGNGEDANISFLIDHGL